MALRTTHDLIPETRRGIPLVCCGRASSVFGGPFVGVKTGPVSISFLTLLYLLYPMSRGTQEYSRPAPFTVAVPTTNLLRGDLLPCFRGGTTIVQIVSSRTSSVIVFVDAGLAAVEHGAHDFLAPVRQSGVVTPPAASAETIVLVRNTPRTHVSVLLRSILSLIEHTTPRREHTQRASPGAHTHQPC